MEKKNIMMIVIIVLLLVLLGTIVGVSVFAYNFMKNSQSLSNSGEQAQVVTVKKLTPDQVVTISLGKPINTNLLPGTDGRKDHVIRVGITVDIDNEETKDKKLTEEKAAFIEMIQTKLDIIQSVSLIVVREKTLDDMVRPDAQEQLAQEILTRLQEEFNSNLIVNVHINELATQ